MKTCKKILFTCLTLTLLRVPSQAASGDVDVTFDPGSSVNGIVRAMAIQNDGKILIGGDFTTMHGAMRAALARLNPDGTLDAAFLPSITQTGSLYSSAIVFGLALQADGKIVISGDFDAVNGVGRTNLARLNADGTLDASFLNGQTGPNDTAYIALQGDGKILLCGYFTAVNGVARTNLARVNSDGTLDTTFLNGLAGASGVSCFALQPDGKILIGGSFTSVNGLARTNLARLNSDGSLDASFLEGLAGPSQVNGYGRVAALAVQPDGRILLAGLFDTVNGVARTNVARLNVDGTLDGSFIGPAGVPLYFMSTTFGLQTDGRILLGAATGLGPPTENALVRLNTDGSLDPSFAADLPEPYGNGGVFSLALDPSGKVLAGGGSGAQNVAGKFLVRLKADGSRDETFNPGPTGPNNEVLRVATQADGRVLLGGRFTSVNGVARARIARLLPDGSLDPSFLNGLAGADGAVWALLPQTDGKIVVGGEFTSINGAVRFGIARLNQDGSLDESFANDLGGYVYALGQQTDGKIIVGGQGRANNIARLNPDGSTDTSFLANITGFWGVMCLTMQQDGHVVIGGYFDMVNGHPAAHIARLNADGSLDLSFAGNVAASVWAVVAQADGKIVIGGMSGDPVGLLARLNQNGSLDASFHPSWRGLTVYALALQRDGKLLIGGQGGSSDLTRLQRLNTDGSADPSFVTTWQPWGDIFCVLLQPDGKILLSGGITAVNRTPRSFVARLVGEYAPPVILEGPQSQTAEVGSSATFSVRATGAMPLAYQWYFNGGPPMGAAATGSVYALTNVQPVHAGIYTVIITNVSGAVTSAPAVLSVIPAVDRRMVPAVILPSGAGSLLHLEYADNLAIPLWSSLSNVTLGGGPQFCFDLSQPLPAQRFYRAWQTNGAPLSLSATMATGIPLSGTVGSSVRVDYINAIGPIDQWVTLGTVTLTNPAQLYFDTSAFGQPPRLYRLVTIP